MGEKFVMPESISVGGEAFANYLKAASLPRNERHAVWSKFSNEQKADFIKVNLALQFVKRPNMTNEQKDFISDSLSKVSADSFNKDNPQKVARANEIAQEIENKALGLFAYKELGDFIEPLMTSKVEEAALVQKYENLLKTGTQLRRSLVKQMPIAEQVNVWKTQMAYHLAASSFNKEQKEFIVEFMSNVQSVFDASATLSGDERTRYVDALEASMFKVFTKAEAYAVFMTIGIQNRVADKPESTKQANAVYTSQNLIRPQIGRFDLSKIPELNKAGKSFQFLTSPNVAGTCDCRWYCSSENQTCGGACTDTTEGCGPLDRWACTYKCNFPNSVGGEESQS